MAGQAVRIAACVRWVDVRPEVDPITAEVSTDARRGGFSAADRAAFEVALCLADDWGGSVDLISAGGPEIEPALRELSAAGAARIIRVDSDDVAGGLALAAEGADLVVCGDHSLDGGSGALPALLAHELAAAQALGLVSLEVVGVGVMSATRRLGGGRSERVRVRTPAVISVEGSLASLRRAGLPAVIDAAESPILVMGGGPGGRVPTVIERGPWRPRARVLPPPSGAPRERIVALTGSLVERTPPRRVELDPDAAAAAILAQLADWGYLPS